MLDDLAFVTEEPKYRHQPESRRIVAKTAVTPHDFNELFHGAGIVVLY